MEMFIIKIKMFYAFILVLFLWEIHAHTQPRKIQKITCKFDKEI